MYYFQFCCQKTKLAFIIIVIATTILIVITFFEDKSFCKKDYHKYLIDNETYSYHKFLQSSQSCNNIDHFPGYNFLFLLPNIYILET